MLTNISFFPWCIFTFYCRWANNKRDMKDSTECIFLSLKAQLKNNEQDKLDEQTIQLVKSKTYVWFIHASLDGSAHIVMWTQPERELAMYERIYVRVNGGIEDVTVVCVFMLHQWTWSEYQMYGHARTYIRSYNVVLHDSQHYVSTREHKSICCIKYNTYIFLYSSWIHDKRPSNRISCLW